MSIQTTGRRAEEDTTETGHHQRGGRVEVEKILNKRIVQGKEKFLV